MVRISDKSETDLQSDLLLLDAYMRWALEATKEVIGESALEIILREAGLERMIDNFPAGEFIVSGEVKFGDYARLNAALINHYDLQGKDIVARVGQKSARLALDYQRTVFSLATVLAAKLLPPSIQVKMGLSAIMSGFRIISQKANQEFIGTIEDRGDKWGFVMQTCPFCAGKQAEGCIGWLMEATIEEACRRVFNKFYDVVEVECRAKGDPAGVWEVPKRPGHESVNLSAALPGGDKPLPRSGKTEPFSESLEIFDQPDDPMINMHVVDAYLRWALLVTEDMVGEQSMHIILRQAGLFRLIGDYPPDNLEVSGRYTFADYAQFNASLINFFGDGANSITRHIGRLSLRQGIERQFELFNISQVIASQTLPVNDLLKVSLEAFHAGFRELLGAAGEEWRGSMEQRGDRVAFIIETCPLCAGKRANGCLGKIYEGFLEEGARWLTGDDYEVKEVECRSKGDPAGVWEIIRIERQDHQDKHP